MGCGWKRIPALADRIRERSFENRLDRLFSDSQPTPTLVENPPNTPIEYFRSQVGKTLDRTPSAAGNWLAGTLLGVEAHEIRVAYTVRPDMCNPGRILHGGIASLMLDDVIGMGNFVAGSEFLMTSINLSVDFLSAAQVGEQLEVLARLVRSGSNLNHWEADIRKDSGKIVAKASSNLIKTHVKIADLAK
jgi:uncharacterized protein (TIGR00369 family)